MRRFRADLRSERAGKHLVIETEGQFKQVSEDQVEPPELPPLPKTPPHSRIDSFGQRIGSLFGRQSTSQQPATEEYVVPYGFESDRPEQEDWPQEYSSWPKIHTETKLSKKHFDHLRIMFGFEFGRKIGSGTFGRVYRVTQTKNDGTKLDLACKVTALAHFKNRRSVLEAVEVLTNEAELFRRLDHPNIVKRSEIVHFYDQVTDFSPPIHVLIFMELMEGSLYDLIYKSRAAKLSESETHDWMKQVVSGLAYLHQNRICHLDIKSPNILFQSRSEVDPIGTPITRYYFKLTDFGGAQRFAMSEPMQVIGLFGTRGYTAPEAYLNIPVEAEKADVYALGITLYESLSGQQFTKQHLRRRCLNWTRHSGVTQELAQLFVGMTEKDPTNRWSLDMVANSTWIQHMFKDYYEAYEQTTHL